MNIIDQLKAAIGLDHVDEKIAYLNKGTERNVRKTQRSQRQLNRLLYQKDTAYFIARAAGVLKHE